MRTILREDESGVSEVIGTILILAMTVVLFSVIIVWVSAIPTPAAQARPDVQAVMNPIYNPPGVEIGVNITLTHQGGEAMQPVPTIIYVTSQRGTNPPKTDIVILHKFNGFLATPSGLLDGTDSVWDIGERWAYKSTGATGLRSSDQITIIIVDNLKSIILWTGPMNAPAGTRPPVFVDKWTDGILATEEIDPVQATQGFYIFAKVTDPDNDLNVNSVYVTIPSQLWQYIGYVQIRTGEVWVSNLTAPYNSPSTYQPYRVTRAQLNGNGGALFHYKMVNHGNTTIFIDGWSEAFFQNTQSASGAVAFIVAPCSTAIAANAGGVAPYPGTAGIINDFQYAHTGLPAGCSVTSPIAVFDINTFNQDTGGTPYVMLAYAKSPFSTGSANVWGSATFFMSILVSGMAGPSNYTFAQLTGTGPNPNSCGGLGPGYNPFNHLIDPIVACRTSWYAQVIPFIGMVVY